MPACAPNLGSLLGFVAGDGRPLRRRLLRLLEDHPEAVQRLARLAPHPSGCAELPEAIHHRGRLAVGGQLHARDARRLAREVVHRDGAVAAAATNADLLDDPPRAVRLGDRELRVLVGHRTVEPEASGGADPHRPHAGQPVVVHEVVGEAGPAGEVADEVEHVLAGCRDDGRDGDLAHERAIVPASRGGQTGALGGAGHHREPALARVDALAAHGTAAILGEAREAELAQHAAAVELVHALAGERSATAVGARGVRGGRGFRCCCARAWRRDQASEFVRTPARKVLQSRKKPAISDFFTWRVCIYRYHP